MLAIIRKSQKLECIIILNEIEETVQRDEIQEIKI